jgi:hypothetical protein
LHVDAQGVGLFGAANDGFDHACETIARSVVLIGTSADCGETRCSDHHRTRARTVRPSQAGGPISVIDLLSVGGDVQPRPGSGAAPRGLGDIGVRHRDPATQFATGLPRRLRRLRDTSASRSGTCSAPSGPPVPRSPARGASTRRRTDWPGRGTPSSWTGCFGNPTASSSRHR